MILFAPADTDLLPALELQHSVHPLSVDIVCCWKNKIRYSVLLSEPLKTEVFNIASVFIEYSLMCVLWLANFFFYYM